MRKRIFGALLVLLAGGMLQGGTVKAADVPVKTVYDSPYVTIAPDGEAWTFDNERMGGTNYRQYPYGTTVYTGVGSSLRELNTGEHYYKTVKDSGFMPVGKWVVRHAPAQCIHIMTDEAETEYYHGIEHGTSICLGSCVLFGACGGNNEGS